MKQAIFIIEIFSSHLKAHTQKKCSFFLLFLKDFCLFLLVLVPLKGVLDKKSWWGYLCTFSLFFN
jgi:hypothetical protein